MYPISVANDENCLTLQEFQLMFYDVPLDAIKVYGYPLDVFEITVKNDHNMNDPAILLEAFFGNGKMPPTFSAKERSRECICFELWRLAMKRKWATWLSPRN